MERKRLSTKIIDWYKSQKGFSGTLLMMGLIFLFAFLFGMFLRGLIFAIILLTT